jgi:hypothetical protein
MALLFVLLVHFGGALWNSIVVVPRVRPGRVAEYVWHAVAYPGALALVAGVSIWWILRERLAGAILGSAVLSFHAVRTLLSAFVGEGQYPSPTSSVVAQVVIVGFATVFFGAAISLMRAALAFRQHRQTAGP